MSIEQALKTYLLSYAELTALVGTRIFPNTLPEGTAYPAVSFFMVSGGRDHQTPIAYPTYQLDIWAQSKSAILSVADALRHALQRYKGIMSGIEVEQISIEGERDLDYEPDTKLFHRMIEIQIIYKGE